MSEMALNTREPLREEDTLKWAGLFLLASLLLHGGGLLYLSMRNGAERPTAQKPLELVMFEVEQPKPPPPPPDPPKPEVKPQPKPPPIKVATVNRPPPPPSSEPPPPPPPLVWARCRMPTRSRCISTTSLP